MELEVEKLSNFEVVVHLLAALVFLIFYTMLITLVFGMVFEILTGFNVFAAIHHWFGNP